ncbi:tail assembly protein, partial [Enterobacter intestinihominis]
ASKHSADPGGCFAFGGVKKSAAQFYPLALLYGRRRIGGEIICPGISVQ